VSIVAIMDVIIDLATWICVNCCHYRRYFWPEYVNVCQLLLYRRYNWPDYVNMCQLLL